MGSKEHFEFLEKEKKQVETVDFEKLKTEAIINSEKHLKRISNNLVFFFWLVIASVVLSFIGGLFDFILKA